MSLTRSLRKVRSRTPHELRLLAEAALLLAVTRAATLALPFRRTAKLFGLSPSPAGRQPDAGQLGEARAIAWAVQAAGARLPWQNTCLVRAIAASALLRRRNIPQLLELGVAKDADSAEGFAAHAWLRCGDAVVLGDEARPQFTTVASYA